MEPWQAVQHLSHRFKETSRVGMWNKQDVISVRALIDWIHIRPTEYGLPDEMWGKWLDRLKEK